MRFQLGLGFGTLVVAGALLLAPAARGDDATVSLAVHDGGFEPAEITTAAGARVRLEITNQTPVAIEFESFELNRERVVPPGQTAVVYVSGLDAGRYEFFDDFHHERRGVLVAK